MNDTALMHTDLDLLAERVEKAAALVQRLRDDKTGLERQVQDLGRRLQESEQKLQGQDVASLLTELQGLRQEQRDWVGERREIAMRIESLVKKLEKLEA